MAALFVLVKLHNDEVDSGSIIVVVLVTGSPLSVQGEQCWDSEVPPSDGGKEATEGVGLLAGSSGMEQLIEESVGMTGQLPGAAVRGPIEELKAAKLDSSDLEWSD